MKKTNYHNNPWNFPLPIRRADFVPYKSKHKKYNITIDLEGIERIPYRSPVKSKDLAFADFQTPLGSNHHRSGSGRSAFFKGKYLKGIGRTPLITQWNNFDEIYHASGHLLASAGLREYVISLLLKTKNLNHTIIPCEGILLAPLSKALKASNHKIYGLSKKILPIDTKFHAITVKESSFCRYSNLLWLLSRCFKLEGVHLYFKTVGQYLPLKSIKNPSILEIYECHSKEMLNIKEIYKDFFMTGVYWGSYHNNFTLNGRFLDLELPIYLDRPVIGYLNTRIGPPRPIELIGFEFINIIREFRYFIDFQKNHFQQLRDTHKLGALGKYYGEIAQTINSVFRPSHFLYSQENICKYIIDQFFKKVDISEKHLRILSKAVKDYYMKVFYGKPTDGSILKRLVWTPLRSQFHQIEPRAYYQLVSLKNLGLTSEDFEVAQSFSEMVTKLDQMKDIDETFFLLSNYEKLFKRHFGRT